MTRDQMINLFRRRAGFNTALAQSIILDFFDVAQEYYELMEEGDLPLPWFLFKDADVILESGDNSVVLPADFLAFDDDWEPRIHVDTGLKRLKRVAPGQLPANIGAEPLGCFASAGQRLYFDFAATKDFTVTVYYYGATAPLSTVTVSPWFHHVPLLIVEHALYEYGRSTNSALLKYSSLELQQKRYLTQVEGAKHRLIQYVRGTRG